MAGEVPGAAQGAEGIPNGVRCLRKLRAEPNLTAHHLTVPSVLTSLGTFVAPQARWARRAATHRGGHAIVMLGPGIAA